MSLYAGKRNANETIYLHRRAGRWGNIFSTEVGPGKDRIGFMNGQLGAVAKEEDTAVLEPTWPARYAKFGQFQLDLEKAELREGSKRCKVQSKVYQALLALLSRAGEIVTREEVCRQLWADSIQVNFDANVNTTINKLRLLLGDSPEHPVYIETIPRRGYSFIAQVEYSDKPWVTKPEISISRTAGESHATKGWGLLPSGPMRMVGFVVAGMLLGAILVLAWSFVTSKNHRSQNLGRQNASEASASVNETASVPAVHPYHKM